MRLPRDSRRFSRPRDGRRRRGGGRGCRRRAGESEGPARPARGAPGGGSGKYTSVRRRCRVGSSRSRWRPPRRSGSARSRSSRGGRARGQSTPWSTFSAATMASTRSTSRASGMAGRGIRVSVRGVDDRIRPRPGRRGRPEPGGVNSAASWPDRTQSGIPTPPKALPASTSRGYRKRPALDDSDPVKVAQGVTAAWPGGGDRCRPASGSPLAPRSDAEFAAGRWLRQVVVARDRKGRPALRRRRRPGSGPSRLGHASWETSPRGTTWPGSTAPRSLGIDRAEAVERCA